MLPSSVSASVWSDFDDEIPGEDYSYPVPHSFRRDQYKELAENVIVPRIVLDQIVDRCSWTESPRDSTTTSGAAAEYGGGAGAAASSSREMGGVKVGVGLKPKSSGRARSLNMRRAKVMRAGRKASELAVAGGVALSTAPYSPAASLCSRNGSSTPPTTRTSSGVHFDPTVHEDVDFNPVQEGADSVNETFAEPDSCQSPRRSPTASRADVEKVADMFSELSLSPESPSKSPDMDLNWDLDEQSLCFQNIPVSTTTKDLIQCIESFGKITHIAVKIKGLSDNAVAYVRMAEKSACDWVISCYHGNSLENSTQPVVCKYALESVSL